MQLKFVPRLKFVPPLKFAPLAALVLVSFHPPAGAQALKSDTAPPTVTITGNPLGSAASDLIAPVTTLEDAELKLRAQGSLGETLSHLPGISSTYFGPGASRPIIRGLDGDRIRVLSNSVGNLDASALSFDHAVSIEPIAIDRIEVVRGPAALMYGGNAVGGVVNVLTNRIPQKPLIGTQGALDSRVGGAEGERGGAAMLEAGNGQFALHADGFWRATSDLQIPGFARSARQRALDAVQRPGLDQPFGRAPNTPSRTDGGAIGGAFTWDNAFAGLAYTNHSTNYGSPAERNVRIDLHSDRYDGAAEVRNLPGFITAIKFKGAYTNYVHREIDGGIVSTNFLNDGYEMRLEATHAALPTGLGPLTGAFGVQAGRNRFAAIGDEALVPRTQTQSGAAYLFEELRIGAGKLHFGGRAERTLVNADANATLVDAPTGLLRFPQEQSKNFTAGSASAGALFPLNAEFSFSANLAHTQRAPTYSELFANGPHPATGTYEIGNAGFGVEKSNALDAGLKWKSFAGAGAHTASISIYQTRFENYLTGFTTGRNRNSDGAINATGAFREFAFRAAPAQFAGFEAESRIRLSQSAGTLYLEVKADAVRATNLLTGEPLPRIAPARLSLALNHAFERTTLRLEAARSAAQDRVPTGDLPTDGYTLWNAYASYRISLGNTRVLAWLKGTNLTNRDARLATSVLRDTLPLGGRALQAGIRVDF